MNWHRVSLAGCSPFPTSTQDRHFRKPLVTEEPFRVEIPSVHLNILLSGTCLAVQIDSLAVGRLSPRSQKRETVFLEMFGSRCS